MALFRHLRATLAQAFRDSQAATAVEYGLIISLVVLALMTGLGGLGGQTRESWGNISNKVTAVTPK